MSQIINQAPASTTQLIPRQYQISGIDYLTTLNVAASEIAHASGAEATCARHILSDSPGAGKTPQSIWASLLLAPDPRQSIMILCPAHLAKQWFDYLVQYFPEHRTIWLEGSRQARQRDANNKAKFYICSIQSLRQEFYYDMLVTLYIKQMVRCTIIDESHYVKNKDAVTSQRAKTLTRPGFCPHVILLTATPIVKEADDLYSQLRICDPHTFHRFDLFMNSFCWFNLGAWGYQNVQLRKDAHLHLTSWLWGRTYKDIGLELPPLISYTQTHDMISGRRKVYDDLRTYWAAQFSGAETPLTAGSAMEVMHMLRRITASPDKAADLCSFIEDDPGPYLIATSYKLSAALLSQEITKLGLTPHVITGDVPADDRRLVCQLANKPTDVIIATITSISEGVDLSHCNTVYFYEEDWTSGKMYQFLARVRRHRNTEGLGMAIEDAADGGFAHLHIDQDPNDRPVLVRYFHANKTIDQHIHLVRNNRSTNIKDIIKVELGL